MPSSSFPCIICGAELVREFEGYEGQPRDGIMCSSRGNDGSRVFDPMNGETLCFNICDRCIVEAGERGRVHIAQFAIPVQTDTPISPERCMVSQVGMKAVDRPYVPWHRGLAPSDEHEYLTIDELLARYDKDNYRWNLPREHFEEMKRQIEAM